LTEYQTLLADAYRGELFGESLFGAFAARETDPERVAKLRALERIEATTARQLRALAEGAGIEVDGPDDDAARSTGHAMGAGDLGWDDFVRGLHDALPAFLANFVRLRTLAAEPGDPALVALVAHEQAINAFAELELAGHPDRSRSVLDWYLETVPEENPLPARVAGHGSRPRSPQWGPAAGR
jgi:hypothetical protein